MMAMERQLASLSSLVHQALSTKQNAIELPSLESLRRDAMQSSGDTTSEADSVSRMSGEFAHMLSNTKKISFRPQSFFNTK